MVDKPKRGWQADTCDLGACYVTLPKSCLDPLGPALDDLGAHDRGIEEFRLEDYEAAVLREAFGPVVDLLESGPGFAIVDRLPLDAYTEPEARLVFWLMGQLIGPQHEQSSGGAALFDVRDAGKDVQTGSRYAETNLELTYHTDNARSRVVPDYVALLCVHPAKAGGVSLLVNAYAVYEELRQNHPRALATLCEPFYFDRRGLSVGDEPEVSAFPIFEWNGGELLCRFIRLYIEVGHDKMDQPLTPEQVEALDVFQQTVQQPRLRVEFQMERGQIQITNNHWILHNRTAFVDHRDLARKRHLIRLWMDKPKRHR